MATTTGQRYMTFLLLSTRSDLRSNLESPAPRDGDEFNAASEGRTGSVRNF